MNGFNLSDIQDAKLGGTQLSAIYLGSSQLWPTDLQINEYLWFEIPNTGAIYFELAGSMSDITIEYSLDKTNWTSITLSTSGTTSTHVNVFSDEKLYIRGNNSKYATSGSNYFHFRCPNNTIVGGNIMSLIYGDNFKGQTTLSSTYAFNSLFKSAGSLMSISNLRLPATSIPNYAYQNMFSGNTSINDMIPEIPATYIGYYGCAGMFQACTSLDAVPDLSTVTRVNGYAFANMFSNCSALTVLPDFHNVAQIDYWAPWRYTFSGCTSLVDARWNVNGTRLLPDHLTVTSGGSAYEQMFQGCTALRYAPELTDKNPHAGEFNNMFNGCTNSRFTDIYTHGSSLGTNYYVDIVKNTGHAGNIWKAADVSWDSSQYSQFNYSGSGSTASRWPVYAANYNSGDYQT